MMETPDILSDRMHSAQSYLQKKMPGQEAARCALALFRADLLHYRLYGQTVTGQNAYVLRSGALHAQAPAATAWLNGHGHEQTRFTTTERACLEAAADAAMAVTDEADAAQRHDIDAVFFEELREGEELPVAAASVRESKLTEEELEQVLAKMKLADWGVARNR